MRYPDSSIDTIAPSAIKASMDGSTFKRILVIISGLALVTRSEIILGPSSPLCAMIAEKIQILCNNYRLLFVR